MTTDNDSVDDLIFKRLPNTPKHQPSKLEDPLITTLPDYDLEQELVYINAVAKLNQ